MTFTMTSEEWTDDEGLGYRIVRRRYGYYACVRVIGPDGPWWDFAWHRRPYRTFDSAVRACNRNRRLWQRFVKLGRAKGNRRQRLLQLNTKGRTGKANALGSLPLWASRVADPTLIRMQFKGSAATHDSAAVAPIHQRTTHST